MQSSAPQKSRLSPNMRIGLVVIGFAILTLMMVLAGGGGSIPAEGTPVLNFAATDAQRTLVAELVLSPAPDATWLPFIRGRRKPTHDLAWVGDTLYVATDDGLLVLDPTSGTFTPAPGFPEDAAVQRVWIDDNAGRLLAGLEDNYLTGLDEAGWSEPVLVALVFPPPFPIPDAAQIPPKVNDICEFLGLLAASDGSFWIACPESLVQIHEDDSLTRYLAGGLAGLPGEPTGTLAEGPAGRLWVGLDNGVAALEE
ncbi:hypothetical protein ACFLYO_06930 [Chloroflexota bacterium]